MIKTNTEKLIITPVAYSCPVCGVEWYKPDLDTIDSIGCPGCGLKFELEAYMHEEEPLWHDWREKCYFRMIKEFDNNRESEQLVRESEAIQRELAEIYERELFNQILNDERC